MLDCVGFLILQAFSSLFFWVDFVSTHTLPLLFPSYLPFLLLYKCWDRHILINAGLLRIFIVVRYLNLNTVKTNSFFLQKKFSQALENLSFQSTTHYQYSFLGNELNPKDIRASLQLSDGLKLPWFWFFFPIPFNVLTPLNAW